MWANRDVAVLAYEPRFFRRPRWAQDTPEVDDYVSIKPTLKTGMSRQ